MSSIFQRFAGVLLTLLLSVVFVSAQGTAFSYQGNLLNTGAPANGNFDFEFALYNGLSAGTLVGLQTTNGVAVTNGLFSVTLNFGDAFPGTSRYLEIRVRPAGGGSFTILTPRQAIGSAPYSVRSLSAGNADTATTAGNASQLGGVIASQYVVSGQSVINAGTQFQIGSDRILAAPGLQNTFAGRGAGQSNNNTIGGGINNSFFGFNAGQLNTTGTGNSFYGGNAGQSNTTGGSNSFFGQAAGLDNSTGARNAFYGSNAGQTNQTGSENSFFGYEAGYSSNASNNSFFGFKAGRETRGINNSFFGWSSGLNTTTGTNNSFFGVQSGLNNQTGLRNVFIGRDAGRDNVSGDENVYVGFNAGHTAVGSNNTAVGSNTVMRGSNNTAIGSGASVDSGIDFATAIGAGATVTDSNTISIGRALDSVEVRGSLNIDFGFAADLHADFIGVNLPSNSSNDHVCYATIDLDPDHKQLVRCGVSSARYKKNIVDYSNGLASLMRLRPIYFDWKMDGKHDMGLIAEDVAKVEPLLASYDEKGVVEGIHYDRIGVLLINAVKEQQAQIDAQSKLIRQQQQQIDTLKRLYSRRARPLRRAHRSSRAY